MSKPTSHILLALQFVQWGSKIQTSLDFKWAKRGRIANGPDFEWDLKTRSTTIEIGTNDHHFVKKHWKFGQKCPDFEWLRL